MRLTPELVREAYEKTNITPIKEDYGYLTDEGCAGCGITAVLSHIKGEFTVPEDYEEAARLLGCSNEYASGFVRGFDGDQSEHATGDTALGMEDGNAAWEAVIELTK